MPTNRPLVTASRPDRSRAGSARARAALLLFALLAVPITVRAHPLGNFSVNHFAHIDVGSDRLAVHYVVDLAEIPAFQAQQAADLDGNGQATELELQAYLARVAPAYANGLELTLDGARVASAVHGRRVNLVRTPTGAQTLRIELDLVAPAPAGGRLSFTDRNDAERLGWREIVATAAPGVSVFDSSAFANGITDELRAYPTDLLAAPLAERQADLSYRLGSAPEGSVPLQTRAGQAVAPPRDRLVELIGGANLTPAAVVVALLIAAMLGGLHALSPGHGKTVVGAYLVGTRGTARHAAFLGLTVTITHTLGVFALGLVTLFASQYILPERLLPMLSFLSGMIVLGMGASLLVTRWRGLGHVRTAVGLDHHHDGAHHHHGADALNHVHDHHHAHAHGHAHDQEHSPEHAHGGRVHSRLPPGANGAPITWRSLLALGISGGLVPCPSALVVLLTAISLDRIALGLLLIVAFSVGLAAVLTAIGLTFVYAGRFIKLDGHRFGSLSRILPLVSALVICLIGAGIASEALAQAGVVSAIRDSMTDTAVLSTLSLLGFGFVIGLKHATEADHVAAVSTIVSERTSVLSSSLIGGFWGVGHTLSLFAAGAAVMLLHLEIGERLAQSLELGVAVMLIGLGLNALRKLRHLPGHSHVHAHGTHAHLHPHAHDHDRSDHQPGAAGHHRWRFGARPLVVGMVHGLAGSAALMLVVLSTIQSPLLGFAYIGAFGIGSVGGMMCMSALLGLPVYLASHRFDRAAITVRTLAALFSLTTGLLMTYEIGIVGGLLL